MTSNRIWTPWGFSQYSTTYAEGEIVFYSTASHGGFKVSPDLNNRIPDYARKESGWYEEDCESAIVVYFLSEYFSEEDLSGSIPYLKNWFPDIYERATNAILDPDESFLKRDRLFSEKNKNNWVCCRAIGTEDDFVKCHARIGRKGNEIKIFLVPKDEYCWHTPFVIDPSRHKEIPR